MRISVLTICYREEQLIESVLKNWQGKVFKHLVLETSKPWHGQELPKDRTEEICRKYPGVEYISLPWSSESNQRNWGLGYLYDCDYVLIVDADELYTEADQFKILESVGDKSFNNGLYDNLWCYRVPGVKTYFKTPEYALTPHDTHQPILAVDPKKVSFTEHRQVTTSHQIQVSVTMHHLSYLRSDLRLYHKFKQFEHFNEVKEDWFNKTWKSWTPDMEDVKAYGQDNQKAVKDPMPEELKLLLQ